MRQTERAGRWYRSYLFVPGQKLDWMLKAPKYGADALILDFEDAVPNELKPVARERVAQALDELADESCGRFVRTNGWRTGHLVEDVLAIVRPGLDGIMLPKTEDVEDVQALDLLLTDLELTRGLEPGRIEIVPLPETSLSLHRLYDICRASERVKRTVGTGNAVRGGDTALALGIDISREGDEAFYFGAIAVQQARAAGLSQLIGGLTTEINDVDLVRRLNTRSKAMGSTGAFAIHPIHIPVINEVYSPSEQEVAEARETIEIIVEAERNGSAAVTLNGRMVDYAHARSSLELLRQAASLGIDVGTVPELDHVLT
jgi:citrate lyase subunit beta/citryl-CoA lyase